ncbi:UNVERIFIED_CONTAM: putative mitochondrial protein [Sesamum calycinum]|uniref:Mitochondrial protein n=1 Tax=Sesamum calycinum TaxID=2727403 RepID=A0AAW2SYX3_9LAMI
MMFPERLLNKVLKARYFPNGDIFTATLGSRPSYTWRSIMAAFDLFRAGCRWRVGTGAAIRVWADPWLPRPTSFRPITPAPTALVDMRVSDLIDPFSLDWDVPKIRSLFWPIDSDLISSIPLGNTTMSDLRIWQYARNEMFSVRSAYHLACTLEDRPCSSSLRQNEHSWWR